MAAAVMNGLMNHVKTEIILTHRSKGLMRGRHAMRKSFEMEPRLHRLRWERKTVQF